MNVVIKIDEYEITDDNYLHHVKAPTDMRNKDEEMSNSVRTFVNTYGIAVQKKTNNIQSG